MKKILSGILALCLSLTLLTACDRGGQPGKTVTAGGLTFAKSYSVRPYGCASYFGSRVQK